MSRVGKKPIPLPKGVKITIGARCWWKAPRASCPFRFRRASTSARTTAILEILRDSDERAALHGLTRALAANAVQGVSTGFTRELDIVGIGYRADVKGKIATFTLGYSHPIEVLLPDGVDLKIDKQTHLVLSGYDKQMLGQVAANMRALASSPIRTRTRASATPAKLLRKKVGKTGGQQGRNNMAKSSKNEIRGSHSYAHPAKLRGSQERPRLAVFRSVKHIYAQVIDDREGRTLVAASSERKGGEERAATAAIWPAPRRSASWWPSAPRKRASAKWCSIAAGICITAA